MKPLEPANYDFEDLAIWRTKLPNAKHAVLPPQNNRPNPLVSGKVRAKNGDLNSTPVVVSRLVIVTTNANMAAAYDLKTGSRVWRQALDGPSTFGPLLFHNMLVAITHSIYFLLPKSGKVVCRFSWKNNGVDEADCTQRDVVCMLRGRGPPDGKIRSVGLNLDGIRFTQSSSAYVAFIRFAPETKLIYISQLQGIDVRRQMEGALMCKIKREPISSGIGTVDVKGKGIYTLTGDG